MIASAAAVSVRLRTARRANWCVVKVASILTRRRRHNAGGWKWRCGRRRRRLKASAKPTGVTRRIVRCCNRKRMTFLESKVGSLEVRMPEQGHRCKRQRNQHGSEFLAPRYVHCYYVRTKFYSPAKKQCVYLSTCASHSSSKSARVTRNPVKQCPLLTLHMAGNAGTFLQTSESVCFGSSHRTNPRTDASVRCSFSHCTCVVECGQAAKSTTPTH